MHDKRILLVEDEPGIRDALTVALREEGYLVDAVASVAEALSCLATAGYELVIADWKLPDGDGTLVADCGAQLGAQTLVMSGHLFYMPGGRAQGHQTIMKPFGPNRLLAAVRQAIGEPDRSVGLDA